VTDSPPVVTPPAADAWPDLAGSAYRDLIDNELAREYTLKDSFESRAMDTINSAGTITSLLFGLAVVVTQATDYTPSKGVTATLAVALAFLIVSAIAGLVVNSPMSYGEPGQAELSGRLDAAKWNASPSDGQIWTARLEILQIVEARKRNKLKAQLLIVGLATEIIGVAVVAIAILEILT
jgi:hypothetical protein